MVSARKCKETNNIENLCIGWRIPAPDDHKIFEYKIYKKEYSTYKKDHELRISWINKDLKRVFKNVGIKIYTAYI